MQLSEQQQKAVEHIGTPALVVAGAGSGKTRTLTAKISYLLNQGYDPARILAITFTNKAAGEMKSRLVRLTGLHLNSFPWVRTYHSACYAILKEHCELLGYAKPLQIMSTYHQEKTMKEVASELNYEKKHVSGLISDISRGKNHGDPEDYFKNNNILVQKRLSASHALYEQKLREKNAIDFDNILCLTRNILRDYPEVRKKYRSAFDFILVDEYQDSNNIQEELTGLLLGEHNNLFCVGDDWQSVYGFRGSNINHFLSFEQKYDDAKIFKLEQNYRSADEIVQVANLLIDHNPSRMKKMCYSDKKGGVISVHRLFDEFQEAEWVIRKIMVLKEMGMNYDDIAIIYRTKALSLWFEKAFRKMKISYTMMGSKGFFDRKEILDINCYLASAFYPRDDVSFERIINTPKRGIGPGMIKKIRAARIAGAGLFEAAQKVVSEKILTKKIHCELKNLLQLLEEIREMKPDAAIRKIIKKTGYMEYLQAHSKTKEEFNSREENIDELIYLASLKNTMEEYLEETTLVNEDREDEDDSKGVKLSTVHASKGLEFKSVFIAGCEETIFPHWRSMESDFELQEERRLMYVAVTRAEKQLFLTSATSRRNKRAKKSRFIYEIEDALDEIF